MIAIESDGQTLVATNYWQTEHAAGGYLYLSWNAGAARLLVPDTSLYMIPEMQTGRTVIVSHGTIEGTAKKGYELLFEDHSDAPFSVQLQIEQSDRLLPDADQGGGFVVAVWTSAGKALELPGKFRKVKTIPCLEPWQDH